MHQCHQILASGVEDGKEEASREASGEHVALDTVATAVQERKKRCPVRPSANSANAGHQIGWRIVPMQE